MLNEDNPYQWGVVWKVWTGFYFLLTVLALIYFLTERFTQPDFTTLNLIAATVAYPTTWWFWCLTWIARRATITVRVRLAT